jgi:hypothetical protein
MENLSPADQYRKIAKRKEWRLNGPYTRTGPLDRADAHDPEPNVLDGKRDALWHRHQI